MVGAWGWWGMSTSNARRSNGSLRDKRRIEVAAQGRPCHLCGGPIDYALEPGQPESFEVDEIVPVSRYWETGWHPWLRRYVGPYASAQDAATSSDNLTAAHRICNQRRGNKRLVNPAEAAQALAGQFPTSQDWRK